ncbi:MAG: hypothetical protein ABFS09_03230 [Thermodesulfobacteriota bacterium]
MLPASDYIAPRQDPFVHPGRRPPSSYLLDGDGYVRHIGSPCQGLAKTTIQGRAGQAGLNDYLKRHNVSGLEERIPVVAYGTNPCPGQLVHKFSSHCSTIVPVFKGSIANWDTVYKFIFDAGYAFTQLIPSAHTAVEAWLTLLDQDQFVVMNKSEGVFTAQPDYHVGIFSDFLLEGAYPVDALIYVGNTKIFLSPQVEHQRNTPVAVAEISAGQRHLPALSQEEILEHCYLVFDLATHLEKYEESLAPFSGTPVKKLARYLSKNFSLQGSGFAPDGHYQEILNIIKGLAENEHCHTISIAEMPEIQKKLLAEPNKSPLRFGDTLPAALTA